MKSKYIYGLTKNLMNGQPEGRWYTVRNKRVNFNEFLTKSRVKFGALVAVKLLIKNGYLPCKICAE